MTCFCEAVSCTGAGCNLQHDTASVPLRSFHSEHRAPTVLKCLGFFINAEADRLAEDAMAVGTGVGRFVVGLCAGLALGFCAGAQAQSPPFPWIGVEFDLISTTGGPTRGGGGVVLAGELFQPGAVINGRDNLLIMLVNPAWIPGPNGPTATVFQQPDLTEDAWIMTLDDQGRVSNLNFFTHGVGANRDGFSIEGHDTFRMFLCAGAAVEEGCAGGSPAIVDDLLITNISVSVINAVPEPGAGWLLLGGLLPMGLAARHKRPSRSTAPT